jgi:type VI protein secretion system component VasK
MSRNTGEDYYFTDLLFKSFLADTDGQQKNFISNKTTTDKLFVVISFLCLMLTFICMHCIYITNIEDLRNAENVLYIEGNDELEQLYILKKMLPHQRSWQNKVLFFFPSSQGLERFLDKKINDYLAIHIVPFLVSTVEDQLKISLTNSNIYSTDILEIYAMVTGIESFDIPRVQKWYLENIDNMDIPYGINLSTLEQVINLFTPDLFKHIKPDIMFNDKIISEFNNYGYAEAEYQNTQKIVQEKHGVGCADFVPQNQLKLFNDKLCAVSIPYLYTDRGYLKYLDNQAGVLNKILSISAITKKLNLDSIKKSIQETNYCYIRDYSSNWNNFLRTMTFKQLNTIEQALNTLQMLSLNPTFLSNFMQQMDSKFVLTKKILIIEKTKLLDGIQLDAINNNDIADIVNKSTRYTTLQNDMVLSMQSELEDVIKKMIALLALVSSSSDSEKAAFEIIKKYETTPDYILIKAEQIVAKLPMPLNNIYTSLIKDIKILLYQQASAYINHLWRVEIFEYYIDNIQEKYPLVASNTEQLLIKDLTDFFATGGIIDSFRHKYLSLTGININTEADELLQFADQFNKDWLDKKRKLKTQFMLIPWRMDDKLQKVIISVFGKKVTFDDKDFDPQMFKYSENDNANSDYVKIEFIDKYQETSGIFYSGPWSWYKFLKLDQQVHSIQTEDKNKISIKMPLGSFEFMVKFKSDMILLNAANLHVPSCVVNQNNSNYE